MRRTGIIVLAAGILANSVANPVRVPFDITPSELHLALADGANVRAMWKTANATSSRCEWGQDGKLTASAVGTSVEYLPGAGWHHTVKLAPLLPSTTYAYTCGDENMNSSTPLTAFTTAPPAGDAQPWTAYVLADWGWENSTVRPTVPLGGLEQNWTSSFSMDLIRANAANASFVWIVGDIGYPDDAFLGVGDLLTFGPYESVEDGFMSKGWMGGVAASTPTMVTPGNHEVCGPWT
jgi:hypothetical protein